MDRFQYIAESGPNIAFSKTLKQAPFFSGLRTRVLVVNAAAFFPYWTDSPAALTEKRTHTQSECQRGNGQNA